MIKKGFVGWRVKNGIKNPNLKLVALAAPARHALRALAALPPAGESVRDLAVIARRARLRRSGLAKVFQLLSRAGVLESRRGPGGGYRLALPAREISLESIVDIVDARGRRGRCLLEERECGEGGTCVLHQAAVESDERMRRALRGLTVADLSAAGGAP